MSEAEGWIKYQCPRCHRGLRIPIEFIGKPGHCNHCNAPFVPTSLGGSGGQRSATESMNGAWVLVFTGCTCAAMGTIFLATLFVSTDLWSGKPPLTHIESVLPEGEVFEPTPDEVSAYVDELEARADRAILMLYEKMRRTDAIRSLSADLPSWWDWSAEARHKILNSYCQSIDRHYQGTGAPEVSIDEIHFYHRRAFMEAPWDNVLDLLCLRSLPDFANHVPLQSEAERASDMVRRLRETTHRPRPDGKTGALDLDSLSISEIERLIALEDKNIAALMPTAMGKRSARVIALFIVGLITVGAAVLVIHRTVGLRAALESARRKGGLIKVRHVFACGLAAAILCVLFPPYWVETTVIVGRMPRDETVYKSVFLFAPYPEGKAAFDVTRFALRLFLIALLTGFAVAVVKSLASWGGSLSVSAGSAARVTNFSSGQMQEEDKLDMSPNIRNEAESNNQNSTESNSAYQSRPDFAPANPATPDSTRSLGGTAAVAPDHPLTPNEENSKTLECTPPEPIPDSTVILHSWRFVPLFAGAVSMVIAKAISAQWGQGLGSRFTIGLACVAIGLFVYEAVRHRKS